MYYDLILADIPGLIEGSSLGKGLGTKFLRHIERTRISFSLYFRRNHSTLARDYKTIRHELGTYSKELLIKPEYLFLSKSDLFEKKELKERLGILKKLNPNAIAVSIADEASMEKIKKILNKIQKGKLAAAKRVKKS